MGRRSYAMHHKKMRYPNERKNNKRSTRNNGIYGNRWCGYVFYIGLWGQVMPLAEFQWELVGYCQFCNGPYYYNDDYQEYKHECDCDKQEEE